MDISCFALVLSMVIREQKYMKTPRRPVVSMVIPLNIPRGIPHGVFT